MGVRSGHRLLPLLIQALKVRKVPNLNADIIAQPPTKSERIPNRIFRMKAPYHSFPCVWFWSRRLLFRINRTLSLKSGPPKMLNLSQNWKRRFSWCARWPVPPWYRSTSCGKILLTERSWRWAGNGSHRSRSSRCSGRLRFFSVKGPRSQKSVVSWGSTNNREILSAMR